MQVNFYDYATTVNQVKEFGLVDPGDKEGKKPAFVSYDKSTDKWNGTVPTVITGGNTSTFLDLSKIKK